MKIYFVKLIFTSMLVCLFQMAWSQDWSMIGKTIPYSDTLKKAKTYSNIDKALKNPEKVISLNVKIGFDTDNFTKFHANMSKFKNLRKLQVNNYYYNSEVMLSDSFLFNFPKLEYLNVFAIEGVSLKGIGSLVKLKYLDIDGAKYKVMPLEICKITSLEFLNLSVNLLSELPREITELVNLREIELTNNCFTSIPVVLAELPKLEYITINNAETKGAFQDGRLFCENQIIEYPSYLEKFKELKFISFYKVEVDTQTKERLKTEFPDLDIKY